jgi:hypothetical protein
MGLNISGSVISSSDVKLIGTTNVIQRGLVLHLDASTTGSYPGSETKWYDLSGNLYNGTLTNGPTFSTTNGGCIVFDGSNDYVELNNNSIISGNQSFTIESFYTITGANGGALFGNYGPGYTSNTIWFSGQYGIYINGSCYASSHPITSGTHHMVATRDSSGVVKLYLDGSLSNTATLNASIGTPISYRIGTDAGSTQEPFAGNLYNMRVYNRNLSENEVLQNYNIQKGRYGL